MANEPRSYHESLRHQETLKQAAPEEKIGFGERLVNFFWDTRDKLNDGPLGTVADASAAFYGPRGPAEDIRHKLEEAVYGRAVTPWSHDPTTKEERDIHGNGPGVDDDRWNRMDSPEMDDSHDYGIDR